jgi:hypothetical protein
MLIPKSAYNSHEFSSGTYTVYVADIACILCTRALGTAVDRRWPPTVSVLIQFAPTTVLRRVELRRLRCPECGGNTSATEVTTRLLRHESALDWDRDQPRRGRPPKWLVEQRRAAREDRSA